MKVCVLYAPAAKGNEKMKAIAKALSEGIAAQGHMVDVLDMSLEGAKIVSFYDYLVIGTENTTFFGGKIPSMVESFLKTAGAISGKRCMAFITKGGIRSMKTLQTLMKAMEKEGMFLKKSEILSKADFARAVGKHLQI
ncbi:MAG: flavodoxin family protein [Sphaerochaeta sp.]|jgi:flavodoxin|uniref:flavodoxin family protein n=1 Tax=Sphaerochaeta sp. TaxID=1972642 RepID=UPI002FC7A54A